MKNTALPEWIAFGKKEKHFAKQELFDQYVLPLLSYCEQKFDG